MSFCGQCGLQLAPGDTRCPHCGAVVEPDTTSEVSDKNYYPDDRTMQSTALQSPSDNSDYSPPPSSTSKQKLILRQQQPDYDYETTSNDEATSLMGAQNYGTTPRMPTRTGQSYTGYQQQQPYAQQGSYPGYQGAPEQYPPHYTGQFPGQASPQRNSTGRTTGLIFILLGILLLLSAITLFLLQHNGIVAGTPPATSGTVDTSSVAPTSPADQAKAVVQHYYGSVNSQDYTTAYHLWKNNQQSYQTFANGYKHTKETTVIIGTTVKESTARFRVNVLIHAVETNNAGTATHNSNYQGYYIIEQQSDGTWLIFDGNLYPV